MTGRDAWVPISADPANRNQRLRTVERRLREHRVRRIGETPCEGCGGGMEACEERDVCSCGVSWLGPTLMARCLSNAQRAEESA